MSPKFNPPPNWPQPPAGWSPGPGWQPDPAWGPAPAGWQLWAEPQAAQPALPAPVAPKAPQQRVFISYRRSDCQPQANGLHDGLCHRMKSASIFMDIDSIPPGADFEQHIRAEIEICDVVLVLIGDNWLDPAPGTETRRIDEPDDFVRLEIESALASPRVRTVPVLVEGAQMPRAAALPESIRPLARINAIELSDRHWISDLERLAKLIERIGKEEQERAQRAVTGPGAQAVSESPAASEPDGTVRLIDIDDRAVARAVALMPSTFNTKDLSGEPGVLAAHQNISRRRNYHTMMGRYLAKNHMALGLQPPADGVEGRGATWRKVSARAAASPPIPPPSQVAAVAAVPASQPEHFQRDRTPFVGWLMVALPSLTCGLAGFVSALWAGSQRPKGARFRRRMFAVAAAIGVLSIGGFVLLGSSPTDADGTPIGAQSNVGGAAWLCGWVIATIVAVVFRKPRRSREHVPVPAVALPGVAQEVARRHQREQYRGIVESDLSLARSIGIGRPDWERDFNDGGLLDLNNLSAAALSRFGPMATDEAQRIVEARQRLERLSSVDEVVIYADLSERTASVLRERAVFL